MFQFKQFRILQDKCAMKVCTDACILGAHTKVNEGERILDIGTGTGLLSLMLAQKNEVKIEAIEIDHDAALQAKQNISASPFSHKIVLHQGNILDYPGRGYDVIISNPPFFSNQLNSENDKKNKAKHDQGLLLKDLSRLIHDKLSSTGRAVILLPLFEMQSFISEMDQYGFFVAHKLKIRHSESKPFFREIVTFSRKASSKKEEILTIYENDNKTYSNDFESLLREYYIIF